MNSYIIPRAQTYHLLLKLVACPSSLISLFMPQAMFCWEVFQLADFLSAVLRTDGLPTNSLRSRTSLWRPDIPFLARALVAPLLISRAPEKWRWDEIFPECRFEKWQSINKITEILYNNPKGWGIPFVSQALVVSQLPDQPLHAPGYVLSGSPPHCASRLPVCPLEDWWSTNKLNESPSTSPKAQTYRLLLEL